MTNPIKKIFVVGVLFIATAAYAQVARSVTGGGGSFWAGGEFSRFATDYGGSVAGPGAIFDFNATPKIGIIGEARWMHWNGNLGQTQSDYLVGGKYRAYRWRRFDFDAKLLVGGVWVKFTVDIGTGSYFAYAPGGFVDYHLTRNFRIRGDYEYQLLPSAPNIPGQPTNGLTPHGFSVGVEYRVFH
ncbi:MAG: outer membrane beta-barrel protein [Acidobacteriaceae bacterium]